LVAASASASEDASAAWTASSSRSAAFAALSRARASRELLLEARDLGGERRRVVVLAEDLPRAIPPGALDLDEAVVVAVRPAHLLGHERGVRGRRPESVFVDARRHLSSSFLSSVERVKTTSSDVPLVLLTVARGPKGNQLALDCSQTITVP
jgi:hypothetical protein